MCYYYYGRKNWNRNLPKPARNSRRCKPCWRICRACSKINSASACSRCSNNNNGCSKTTPISATTCCNCSRGLNRAGRGSSCPVRKTGHGCAKPCCTPSASTTSRRPSAVGTLPRAGWATPRHR